MYKLENPAQQMAPQGYPHPHSHPHPHSQNQLPTADYNVEPTQDYTYPQPNPAANMPANMIYPRPPPQAHAQQQAPDLRSKGGTADGRHYSLDIAQQPDRARMCGFGDKDRRPITPPPCIRLCIIDESTNQDIDYTQIDSHHYILQVDLWNPEGTAAVNCVQHSNTSPSVSISMATTTSYPPQPEQHYMMHGMGHQQYMHPNAPGYGQYPQG